MNQAGPPTPSTDRFVPGPGRPLALLAIAAAGIGLAAAPGLVAPAPAGLVSLLGFTLVVYAVMLALSWYPLPGAARPVEKFFEGVIDHSSSGWYLAVTLGWFARAETRSFLDFDASGLSLSGLILGWVKSHFLGFSLGSFMNALWAALWPMQLMEDHGAAATAVFGAIVYGLYALGAKTLGEPNIARDEEDDEGDEADAGAGGTDGADGAATVAAAPGRIRIGRKRRKRRPEGSRERLRDRLKKRLAGS